MRPSLANGQSGPLQINEEIYHSTRYAKWVSGSLGRDIYDTILVVGLIWQYPISLMPSANLYVFDRAGAEYLVSTEKGVHSLGEWERRNSWMGILCQARNLGNDLARSRALKCGI